MQTDGYDFNSMNSFEKGKIEYISTEEIISMPNHPFRVVLDQNMMELIESIKRVGVTTPVVVRPIGDGIYQMVSGHRRKVASEFAERFFLPCIVKELSDEDAIIHLVDSNIQREEILPSEKAFAYKMRLDAMKRKAGRPKKKNSVPLAQNLSKKTSRQILSELSGESQDQIRRYIRLTELIEPILTLVDEKRIGMRPAVEISYLLKEEQEMLLDLMESNVCMPTHAQTIRLRKLSESGQFEYKNVLEIMSELKGNQKEHLRISKDRLKSFFKPGTSDRTIEETILKALAFYKKESSTKIDHFR